MAWKFVASDDFPLSLLLEYEKFYEDDLRRARESLEQLQAMENKILKGKNGAKIMTNAHNHVKQSAWNVAKVKEAILIAKAKGH